MTKLQKEKSIKNNLYLDDTEIKRLNKALATNTAFVKTTEAQKNKNLIEQPSIKSISLNSDLLISNRYGYSII